MPDMMAQCRDNMHDLDRSGHDGSVVFDPCSRRWEWDETTQARAKQGECIGRVYSQGIPLSSSAGALCPLACVVAAAGLWSAVGGVERNCGSRCLGC